LSLLVQISLYGESAMLEQEKRRERLLKSTGVTFVRGGEPYFNNNVIGTVNITNALFLTVLTVYSKIHSAINCDRCALITTRGYRATICTGES
jgi:hypothetical protein